MMFPRTGIPIVTVGGASSFCPRRKADISARNTQAAKAAPASRAVCGIASIVVFIRLERLL